MLESIYCGNTHSPWNVGSNFVFSSAYNRPDAVADLVEHGARMGGDGGLKPMVESNQ